MKRLFILIIAGAMLLTGCSTRQVEDKLDAAGDMVENGLDQIMDNTTTTGTTGTTTGTTTATTAKITETEAVAIALKHAQTTQEKVTGLRTEYEVDDGVGHYDVRFVLDGREYDYEIDSTSGKILSFDRDD